MLNWNLFNILHTDASRAFEEMCYFLFCEQFNQPYGIFRYKNQAGIETEPIEHDGICIGFQSKYVTNINKSIADICDSINKAKRHNLQLKQYYLYINHEFSEGKKNKKPQAQIKIEACAQGNGMELIWMPPSKIEYLLHQKQNEYIYDMFFTEHNGLDKLIEEQQEKRDRQLSLIKTSIIYNAESIKIDKSSALIELDKHVALGHNTIISGEGGAGKTALVKDYIERHSNYPVLFSKASALYEYATHDVNSSFNIDRINKAFGDQNVKIFVIDSVEYLLDVQDSEPIQICINELQKAGWTIIMTSRRNRLKELMYILQQVYNINAYSFDVDTLSAQELTAMAEKYRIALPRNQYLLDRIRNPFYLNEYLSQLNDNMDATVSMFNQNVWNKKIFRYRGSGDGKKREDCMMSLAKTRATTQSFYIDYESDDVIESLVEDEIIGYDSQRAQYFISHDIFEELSLRRWIDITFNRMKDNFEAAQFFNTIGETLALRRAFRLWLSDKLISDSSDVRLIISCVSVTNSTIPQYWIDEILTAIILSPNVSLFFNNNEKHLVENDFGLFQKYLFVLNISGLDYQSTPSDTMTSLPAMIPVGDGWRCAINFIDNHKEILQQNPNLCLDTLIKWTSSHNDGESTKKAGQIALHILSVSEGNLSYRQQEKKKIYTIIENSAKTIVQELNELIETQLGKPDVDENCYPHDAFIDYIITDSIRAVNIIKSCPIAILKKCHRFWFANKRHSSLIIDRDNPEYHYGVVNEGHHGYFPANAYNTPILYALNSDEPIEALKYVIDFINQVSQNYKNNPWHGYDVEEIVLKLPNGTTVNQYHSQFFWNAYRGTGSPVIPYLIQSVLMALEKYMLDCGRAYKSSLVENILLYILSNSKSSMLTAVVASVVVAYPDKFFNIACILFQSIEYIGADNLRALSEISAMSISSGRYPSFYQKVQYESNQLPHRKTTLEQICFNYQLVGVRGQSEEDNHRNLSEIYAIIDKLNEDLQKDQSKCLQYEVLIARMDRRKNTPRIVSEKDNQVFVQFETQLAPDVKQRSKKFLEKADGELKYSTLYLWCQYKCEKNDKAKETQFSLYEEHPLNALCEAKEVMADIECGKSLMPLNEYIPRYVCSIMLCDFYDLLKGENLEFCCDTIVNSLKGMIYEAEPYAFGDGFEECVKASFVLYDKCVELRDDLTFFYLALLTDKREVSNKYPWEIIAELSSEGSLSSTQETLIDKLIRLYIQHQPLYKKLCEENSTAWGQSVRSIVIRKLFEQMGTPTVKFEDSEYIPIVAEMDPVDVIPLLSIIPRRATNQFYMVIVNAIMPSMSQLLVEGKDRYDYTMRHKAYQCLATFLFVRTTEEQTRFFSPLRQRLPQSNDVTHMLSEFVYVADKMNNPDSFWNIWSLLYNPIVKQRIGGYHRREILMNYFLGENWKETARSWHSLREKDLRFYDSLVKDIPSTDAPTLLYVLNNNMQRIAYPYQNQSIDWIYETVVKLGEDYKGDLIPGTINLIENNMTCYVANNRENVKTNSALRHKLTEILSFAIAQGSAQSYMLRESVI